VEADFEMSEVVRFLVASGGDFQLGVWIVSPSFETGVWKCHVTLFHHFPFFRKRVWND